MREFKVIDIISYEMEKQQGNQIKQNIPEPGTRANAMRGHTNFRHTKEARCKPTPLLESPTLFLGHGSKSGPPKTQKHSPQFMLLNQFGPLQLQEKQYDQPVA